MEHFNWLDDVPSLEYFSSTIDCEVIREEFDDKDGLEMLCKAFATLNLPILDDVINCESAKLNFQKLGSFSLAFRNYLYYELTDICGTREMESDTSDDDRPSELVLQEIDENVEFLLRHRVNFEPMDQVIELGTLTLLLKSLFYLEQWCSWEEPSPFDARYNIMQILLIACVSSKTRRILCQTIELPEAAASRIGFEGLVGAVRAHRNSPELRVAYLKIVEKCLRRPSTDDEREIQQVRDALRASNGIYDVLEPFKAELTYPIVKATITTACKCLIALVRDEEFAAILRELPLIANGLLRAVLDGVDSGSDAEEDRKLRRCAVELLAIVRAGDARPREPLAAKKNMEDVVNHATRFTRAQIGLWSGRVNWTFPSLRWRARQRIDLPRDTFDKAFISFCPRRPSVLVAGMQYAFFMYDTNSGNLTRSLEMVDTERGPLGEAGKNVLLSTYPHGNFCTIRSMEDFALLRTINDITYAELDKTDGTKMVTAYDKRVTIVDLETGCRVQTFQCVFPYNAVTFSWDDTLIFSDSVLFDVRSGKKVGRIEKFDNHQYARFHPNRREILSRSEVWDLRAGLSKISFVKTIPLLYDAAIKFSPVDHVLYQFGPTTNVVFMDGNNYTKIGESKVEDVVDLAINRTNTQVATLTELDHGDHCIKLWDVV